MRVTAPFGRQQSERIAHARSSFIQVRYRVVMQGAVATRIAIGAELWRQVQDLLREGRDEKSDDVLHRHDDHGAATVVDDRDVPKAADLHAIERPGDRGFGRQAFRVGGHHLAERVRRRVAAVDDAKQHVALGEDAEQGTSERPVLAREHAAAVPPMGATKGSRRRWTCHNERPRILERALVFPIPTTRSCSRCSGLAAPCCWPRCSTARRTTADQPMPGLRLSAVSRMWLRLSRAMERRRMGIPRA